MATVRVFDQFYPDLLAGKHVFGTHTYRLRLSQTAPLKDSMTGISSVTAITGTNYSDQTVTLAVTEPTTGTFQVGGTGSDASFTAGAADWQQFRYVYLYNDSDAGKALVSVLDYGSLVPLANGATFTVDAGSGGWAQFVTPAWT